MTGDEKWKAFCKFAENPNYTCKNPFEPWDYDDDTITPAKKRHRKPTLTQAKKQAAKAGMQVARYEIGSDTINIVPANPDETEVNPWDSVQ
jgi:hypothetical protein